MLLVTFLNYFGLNSYSHDIREFITNHVAILTNY